MDSIDISFLKEGFHDTLINFKTKQNTLNDIYVKLREITDKSEIEKQQRFLKHRRQRRISRPLLISSILSAAVSVGLFYKSNQYYEKADQYKQALESTNSNFDINSYEINKEKNKKYTDEWKLFKAGG